MIIPLLAMLYLLVGLYVSGAVFWGLLKEGEVFPEVGPVVEVFLAFSIGLFWLPLIVLVVLAGFLTGEI